MLVCCTLTIPPVTKAFSFRHTFPLSAMLNKLPKKGHWRWLAFTKGHEEVESTVCSRAWIGDLLSSELFFLWLFRKPHRSMSPLLSSKRWVGCVIFTKHTGWARHWEDLLSYSLDCTDSTRPQEMMCIFKRKGISPSNARPINEHAATRLSMTQGSFFGERPYDDKLYFNSCRLVSVGVLWPKWC